MIEEIITGFDAEAFCKFLRSKFASFSESLVKIPTINDFQLDGAAQLGIVKTLAGPNGSNLPLIVVAAKLADGEKLKERCSRLKQFKFAKQVLDQAMANPAPGVDGVITQGLFVFHDDAGNFRLSLVFGKAEGVKLVWSTAKRLSFHVEAGAGNKTFRDRMSLPWGSFDKLKEAFSVEKLTKEFYSRLFAWYQLALASDEVVFPNDVVKGKEAGEVKSEQIIRLITRLMFVWFLKQKHLVPDNLFDPAALKTILKDFKKASGDTYYRAILQNLFFATLNSEIQEREFAVDAGRVSENKEHFGVKTLYRYGGEFAGSEKEVLKLFSAIPFLNGGLFECLDRDQAYYDGFSRNPKKRAKVPNHLFFDEPDGLIPLLQQYNFTVEENSPGDEEVALDPELLGKVFENLLGAYNPETKVAARNATGSFYTPREIVNYMVDESLIARKLSASSLLMASARLTGNYAEKWTRHWCRPKSSTQPVGRAHSQWGFCCGWLNSCGS
jgi:adenine-specific DNA-methyltransferase